MARTNSSGTKKRKEKTPSHNVKVLKNKVVKQNLLPSWSWKENLQTKPKKRRKGCTVGKCTLQQETILQYFEEMKAKKWKSNVPPWNVIIIVLQNQAHLIVYIFKKCIGKQRIHCRKQEWKRWEETKMQNQANTEKATGWSKTCQCKEKVGWICERLCLMMFQIHFW